jgi:carbonyl reductase 1
VYAASRSGADLGFQGNAGVQFRYPQLDITSTSSIEELATTIKIEQMTVDVLFNVAGLNIMKGRSASKVYADNKKIMDVNFRGTLKMCQTFLPLIKPGGRVVNLSSVGSTLRPYREDIQARFRNPKMQISDLHHLVEDYEVKLDVDCVFIHDIDWISRLQPKLARLRRMAG